MRPGDERGEGGRGDLRHAPQPRDIVGRVAGRRLVPDLVGADQDAERLAAGRAELLLVDLLEQLALVELDRPLEIAADLRPADVQQADLGGGAGGAVDQIGDAAPVRFELLQPGRVQDGVELRRDQGVDPGDLTVDRRQQRPAVAQQARSLRPPEPEDERLRRRGSARNATTGPAPSAASRPPPAKMRSIRSGPRPVRS